jgi:WD40 repeat protein
MTSLYIHITLPYTHIISLYIHITSLYIHISSLCIHIRLQLLSSGSDGTMYVWDVRTMKCLTRAVDEGCLNATALAASADGKPLVYYYILYYYIQ